MRAFLFVLLLRCIGIKFDPARMRGVRNEGGFWLLHFRVLVGGDGSGDGG